MVIKYAFEVEGKPNSKAATTISIAELIMPLLAAYPNVGLDTP